MKLGIKYCGGCNPHYDRAQQVKKLLTAFPEAEPVYDTTIYCPVWITICGCPSECVRPDSLRAGTVLSAGSVKDFAKIKPDLQKLLSDSSLSERNAAGKTELYPGMTAVRTRTFSEADLLAFASLSGDRNGLHLDPAVADLTIFRKPVVHGIFVGTLFSAILGTQLPGSGTILMAENVQYTAPVFPGETVTAEIRFTAYTERASAYIGTFEGICRKADGTVAARGMFRELLNKRIFFIKQEGNSYEQQREI